MRGLPAFAAAGLAFLALGAGALAQEDLDKGKSAAQLFASDCAICHKTPQAVVKGGPPGEGFLRQHYTSSRQTAASLAAYLRGISPPAERASKPRSAKPSAKTKAPKTNAGKDTKQAAPKPAANDAKPAEKAPDAKAGEAKAPEKKEEPDKKE